MVAKSEQETTVTLGRMDEQVNIWTNNPVHIRKLEKDTRATRIRPQVYTPGWEEGGFGAEYVVKTDDFNILAFRRKRTMTDEQKRQSAERLRKAREARG